MLLKGGISLSEEDDPLEQIALALDVVKFHAGECQFLGNLSPSHNLTELVISSFECGVPEERDHGELDPCDTSTTQTR